MKPLRVRKDKCNCETMTLSIGLTLALFSAHCVLAAKSSAADHIEMTEVGCGPPDKSATIAHVGFKKGSSFQRKITVCFDKEGEQSYFANHTIDGRELAEKREKSGGNSSSERPSDFDDDFGLFNQSSPGEAFKLDAQRQTLRDLLGAREAKRVLKKSSSFLARGHLAPDADFPDEEGRDATYTFLNVAPQWQTFNNGDWKSVEGAVRDYANKSKHIVEVFTGTHGNLALKSEKGGEAELYLAKRGGKSYVAVPEHFWKILHDPEEKEAVVFVGLNVPESQSNLTSDALCPDRCPSAGWSFGERNSSSTALYCCSYADFAKSVSWVPAIGNKDPGLLQSL